MKKKILIIACSVVLMLLMALMFFQTYMVEESLRASKMMFNAAVNKSMNEVITELNKENIKKEKGDMCKPNAIEEFDVKAKVITPDDDGHYFFGYYDSGSAAA